VPKRLGAVYVAPEELPTSHAPRRPFIGAEDVTALNVVVAGIVGAVGALATAYFIVDSGGRAARQPLPPRS
jgi:hypothetical protein